MSTYFLKRAINQLKLNDAELATYAAALRRRMDTAADIAMEGKGEMPPMDPLIVDLGDRVGAAACESVPHWMTAAWEVLIRLAGERFIEQNAAPVPR